MGKKANREGSIYFDESRNKYKASVVDPNGKRVQKRFKTRQEAEEWVTLTKAAMYKNEYIMESNVKLGEWVLEFLNTFKKNTVRASTYGRYLTTAKNLLPIAEIPLKNLTPAIVQKFYNTLPPLSTSSKMKIHKLLKAALSKAVQLGMIKDIMNVVEVGFKQDAKEIEIYSTDELHSIFTFLESSKYYKRYYLLVKLAVCTGARLGELLALQPKNVYNGYIKITSSASSVNGKMCINKPKTLAGNRTITISPELSTRLVKAAGNSEFVFHTDKGTILNTHTIVHAWKKILIGAGVPHKHFHALRHTHATQLLANRIPLLEVSKRLGHSKTSHTLDLYGHAIPGYDVKIPNVVEKIFLSRHKRGHAQK